MLYIQLCLNDTISVPVFKKDQINEYITIKYVNVFSGFLQYRLEFKTENFLFK